MITNDHFPLLKREVGLWGAVLMGLGSIMGTGVFVSLGIAAGVAGQWLILSVILAAGVALCNGLSSAQLAANHPMSGGTYEYGYRYLSPRFGFVAGWLFLLAKSASAATAALGLSGYLLNLMGNGSLIWTRVTALFMVAIITVVVMGGIKRSNLANMVIVSVTLLALALFIIFGSTHIIQSSGPISDIELQSSSDLFQPRAILHATALMFVAYTGYGRIATLGEEVHNPRQTIPRAMLLTLGSVMIIYVGVATVSIAAIGSDNFAAATHATAAPLEMVARLFHHQWLLWLVTLGAMSAMAGVLLNLILGLSRVLLAMGRRGDMPPILATIRPFNQTPVAAIGSIGLVIALLVLIGDVTVTWSFSAFTILIYYAITNWATFKLTAQERLYPRWVAVIGLVSCVLLAFFVDTTIWLLGLGLIGVALAWQKLAKRLWQGAL